MTSTGSPLCALHLLQLEHGARRSDDISGCIGSCMPASSFASYPSPRPAPPLPMPLASVASSDAVSRYPCSHTFGAPLRQLGNW
eukprot:1172096-Rhodomonas_salina.1